MPQKNRPPKILLLQVLLFLLLSPVFSFAQTAVIRGTVKDETGQPLVGASVGLLNSIKKVSTNSKGAFQFQGIAAGTYKIAVSYLGYISQEQTSVLTNGQVAELSFTMNPTNNPLDEVLVTGYGTVRRRDLTGSLEKVNMNDAIKAPVRSFEEMLAGRIAGIQVGSADGQPGANIDVVIRGNNSLTQNNKPLYVIDGFPVEDAENNIISPQDIESIEVLKDASATAIYGARGANGVIMITTKSGAEGRTNINFSVQTGIQKNIKLMELMSPYEFLKYQLERDGSDAEGSPKDVYLSGGQTLESYKSVKPIDWQSMMFRTAPTQDYALSLTGGTDKTRFSISGSVYDQQGIIINSGYSRYQGRIKVDQKVTDKLKAGVNLNYSYLLKSGISPSLSTNSSTTNLLYSLYAYRPMKGAVDLSSIEDELFDGDIDQATDYRINPIINQKNLVRNNKSNNLTANAYLEYAILPELTLRITGGYDSQLGRVEAFNNSNTLYGNKATTYGASKGVNGSVTNLDRKTWLNENTLTWKKTYDKHNFEVLGGLTEQASHNSAFGFSSFNITNETLGINGLKSGTPSPDMTSSASEWSLVSLLGRINYNYNSKYYVTASYRADGSSRFSDKHKWGYFPSAALSWRFSSEEFFKGFKALNEGKLRVSYGLTGNNGVSDYAPLRIYDGSIGYSYVFNNQYIQSFVPVSPGNEDLKWETTSQFNAGVDLGFFNNRLNVTADIYRKKTYDLLLNANLPTSTGFTKVFKNIGKIQNQGLELTVNMIPVSNSDFTWNSNFNIAFNKSKILGLAENEVALTSVVPWDNNWQSLVGYISKIGEPVGQMYGFVWDGVYQYQDFNKTNAGTYILKDEVPANGKTRAQIQPGDIKYKDLNGDGVVNELDYTVIGRGLPLHVGGFNNTFTYKDFDLNILLQWSYGNDVQNANRMMFEGNLFNKAYLNQFASYTDRWTPENTGSTMYRTNGFFGAGYSSRTIEDASYLRLKTVSLGYTFKESLLRKIKINRLRVFASAQNLLTLTGYSGVDPEVNNYSSVLTPGFDYSSYPRALTVIVGAKLTL